MAAERLGHRLFLISFSSSAKEVAVKAVVELQGLQAVYKCGLKILRDLDTEAK